MAIGVGIKPRRADYGLIRLLEIEVGPKARGGLVDGSKEAGILNTRHLTHGYLERVDPNAVHGLFIVAAGFTAHAKPAFGN
jgi:hypothetical protein